MEFLTNKEIAIILDKSPSTATRVIQTIKDAMEIKRKELTIDEFCYYMQLDKTQVEEKLHKIKKKTIIQ